MTNAKRNGAIELTPPPPAKTRSNNIEAPHCATATLHTPGQTHRTIRWRDKENIEKDGVAKNGQRVWPCKTGEVSLFTV